MEHRFLGGTGLKVSELCLGAMTFGRETDDFEYDPERSQFLQYAESIVDQTAWRFWWD